MSGITTHVLDTATGRPASGVAVRLERESRSGWIAVGAADTDADGRARSLLPADGAAEPGVYRLTFETRPYFARGGAQTFHPYVVIVFEVADGAAHYHVPLLISPYGYTTYRGS